MPRTCNLISLVLGRAGYRHQLDVNSCCAGCCWCSPGAGKQGGGFHLSGGTLVPSIQGSHALSPHARPSPCTDPEQILTGACPWGPGACGSAEISLSPGVCCWAEAEVGLALQGRADTWQKLGRRLAAWLGHSCRVPRHKQSHARSPSGRLTMVPSPVVSEQPGRGLDMDPVVSGYSQPHKALWLVASGQKIPQQRRKMFLAGSFPAGFHLAVTFLWQYRNPGLTDSASCALSQCREGLGNCWPDGGITWAVRSKPGWQCPTGWWQLQPHETPHKGAATEQE